MKPNHTQIRKAAVAAHEINRLYCQSLGDTSQPTWVDAPEWQRKSAIAGVRAIVNKPSFTPEQSHESWMRVKQEEGWKYGAVKDAEKKTHPCMVAYNELPEQQRYKDKFFGYVVRAMLSMSHPDHLQHENKPAETAVVL